jgi:hypothetical protein
MNWDPIPLDRMLKMIEDRCRKEDMKDVVAPSDPDGVD